MNLDSIQNMTSRLAARLLGRNGAPDTPPDTAIEAQVQARRARLRALRALDRPDAEQELEMLSLALRLDPAADLRQALAAFNTAHPGNAGGLYLAGVAHLKQDDAAGLGLLERAMELDPDAIPAACEHAHNFLAARGETALAERYALRARLHAAFAEPDEADGPSR